MGSYHRAPAALKSLVALLVSGIGQRVSFSSPPTVNFNQLCTFYFTHNTFLPRPHLTDTSPRPTTMKLPSTVILEVLTLIVLATPTAANDKLHPKCKTFEGKCRIDGFKKCGSSFVAGA